MFLTEIAAFAGVRSVAWTSAAAAFERFAAPIQRTLVSGAFERKVAAPPTNVHPKPKRSWT